MTACERCPDDDQLLQYVSGGLGEPERSTLEDHLFGCDACLERVERYQAARQALSGRALPVTPTVPPADGEGAGAASRLPWWLSAGIAAVLVAGLAALLTFTATQGPQERIANPSRPAPAKAAAGRATAARRTPAGSLVAAAPTGNAAPSLQLAVLAMVTPPPYVPTVTGGDAADGARLTEGMAAYARGDWGGVSRALHGAVSPPGRFYLAIAMLMRGDSAAAVSALDDVRRSEQQPYARESVFYLGKAELQRGDVGKARTWFAAAREADAGPDGEAARLLTELDDLAAR